MDYLVCCRWGSFASSPTIFKTVQPLTTTSMFSVPPLLQTPQEPSASILTPQEPSTSILTPHEPSAIQAIQAIKLLKGRGCSVA